MEVMVFAITGSTGAAVDYTGTNDSLDYAGTQNFAFPTDLILTGPCDVFAAFAVTAQTTTDVITVGLTVSSDTPVVNFTTAYSQAQVNGQHPERILSVSVAQGVPATTIATNNDTSLVTKVPSTGLMGFVDFLVSIPLYPAASLTTLSGPTAGDAGTASGNFTVGVDLPVTGTVTVTPNDGAAGGTFAPSTLSFSGATTSLTFTYNPPGSASSAGTGIRTISITNDGGLSNPSSISYSARGPIFATSDITTTGWLPTALRGTPLTTVVDEVTADDTDYIQSPAINGSQGPVIFQLNKSLVAGSLTIPIRGRFTGTAAQVRVLMTDDAGAVQGTSAWQALTSGFALYSLSVTTTGTSTRIRIEVQ